MMTVISYLTALLMAELVFVKSKAAFVRKVLLFLPSQCGTALLWGCCVLMHWIRKNLLMLKSKYTACCVVLTCDSDKTDTPTHTVHKTFSRFKKCTRTEHKCGYEREASVCHKSSCGFWIPPLSFGCQGDVNIGAININHMSLLKNVRKVWKYIQNTQTQTHTHKDTNTVGVGQFNITKYSVHMFLFS